MYCKKKYISLFLALVMIAAMCINASAIKNANIQEPKGALTLDEERALGITEKAEDIAKRNQKEAMVDGLMCINASAIKNVNIQGPKGVLTLDEERALGITEKVEDIDKRNQKEAMVDRQIRTTRSSADYMRVLSVPTFEQANSYYCGPANTKQVCHYHNGSSLTQDQYAARLGTTTAGSSSIYIQQILAEDTGLNYIRSNISSLTTEQYVGRIKYGMDNSMPAILSIIVRNKGTAPGGIPYKTNGHFITTSGLDTKYDNQIRLTDTNGQWAGATWYDIDVVKEVNQANNYMVW